MPKLPIVSVFVVLLCLTAVVAAEEWPGWRGPSRQGISTESGLPLHWSAAENVVWKTAIPGVGWSSPIVFGDRVFVTTATDDGAGCRVICLDRPAGKVLWNREVLRQVPQKKRQKNSYASPTPVTDGRLVYAVFCDGSMVALDYEGEVVWVNRDYQYFSQHGLGGSPILHGDLLIMAFDGSSPGDDPKLGWKTPWDGAVIMALDKTSGKVRWKGLRGLSRIAHVTPNILRRDGTVRLISGAGDVVQGFDPATGERLWTVYSQGEGVVPSIVLGGGLIFATSGFEEPTIRAIRPGGQGDVTGTHIAWELKKAVPMIPSLLYVDDMLFAINESGIATCLEPQTGEVIWQRRIGGSHSASPIYGDGHVYFLSEEGETTIIEAAREFKIIARNRLDETCQASIAVSGKQLFIRSDRHLYCIGTGGQAE